MAKGGCEIARCALHRRNRNPGCADLAPARGSHESGHGVPAGCSCDFAYAVAATVSVLASFLSVAAFDFFCVPPYLTFRSYGLRIPDHLRRHAGSSAGDQHADRAHPHAGRRCGAARGPHRDALSPVATASANRPACLMWRARRRSSPKKSVPDSRRHFPAGRWHDQLSAAFQRSAADAEIGGDLAQWAFDQGEKTPGRGRSLSAVERVARDGRCHGRASRQEGRVLEEKQSIFSKFSPTRPRWPSSGPAVNMRPKTRASRCRPRRCAARC